MKFFFKPTFSWFDYIGMVIIIDLIDYNDNYWFLLLTVVLGIVSAICKEYFLNNE